MTDRISLLVPSRSRPGQLAAMWESALTTATHPDQLELVVRADYDDPNPPGLLPGNAVVVTGSRIVLSECWNDAARAASGEILWHGGDDIRYRTPGWDTRVRDTFDGYPDRIVFVHGDDGFQGGGLGTHGWLHRAWVDTVGYFVPPHFSSDYNDTWLTDVADMIGRRVYLPDVLTEHLHPAAGKGEWDTTHRERLERHAQDGVDGLYERLAGERAAWADKLRAAITAAAITAAEGQP